MSSMLLLLNPTAFVIFSSEQNLWWSLSHLLGAASDSDSFKPDLGWGFQCQILYLNKVVVLEVVVSMTTVAGGNFANRPLLCCYHPTKALADGVLAVYCSSLIESRSKAIQRRGSGSWKLRRCDCRPSSLPGLSCELAGDGFITSIALSLLPTKLPESVF